MTRVRLVLLLALMAVAAIEPVLHNHSLIPGQAANDALKSNGAYCAACNLSTAGAPVALPAVRVPSSTAVLPMAAPVLRAATIAPLHVPSRAPPAA